MVKLSNSPYEATVLTLEARKSFSLRLELHDRHGNVMSWDNLSATFTLGTLDPLEALLEVPATDGVFRIQASELNLKPGTYQFTITLRSRGYSFVIVKGDVKLVQNTEAGSVADFYGAAIPSETIAVQLDQMNVIRVSLRNTPLTLGTGGGGPSTWSELVGKPLVFPPAQHVHDLQDVGGLVQALADLTASLDGKAPVGHHHPISGVTGLQAALDAKAASSHTHPISGVTGLQTALDAKAKATHTHSEYAPAAHTHPVTVNGGFFAGSTDAVGVVIIPHGLGATPRGVSVITATTSNTSVDHIADPIIQGVNGAAIIVRVLRRDTNSPLATNPVAMYWTAIL